MKDFGIYYSLTPYVYDVLDPVWDQSIGNIKRENLLHIYAYHEFGIPVGCL